METEWITIRDASRLLGVSERSVRRYIKRYDWDSKLDTLSGSSVNQRFVRKSDVLNHMDDDGAGQPPADGEGGASSDGMPLPPTQVREGMERVAQSFEKMAAATEGQAERIEDLVKLQRQREHELASTLEELLQSAENRRREPEEAERTGVKGARLWNGLIWGFGFALGLLMFYGLVLVVILAAA